MLFCANIISKKLKTMMSFRLDRIQNKKPMARIFEKRFIFGDFGRIIFLLLKTENRGIRKY